MTALSEKIFPISGEDVSFLGQNKQRIVRTYRVIASVEPERLQRLSDNELSEALLWARIRTDNALHLSRIQVNGHRAAHLIHEAQYVVKKGYLPNRSRRVATKTTHDSAGTPYHLLAEMYRDVARYHMRVADLTNTDEPQTRALQAIDQAMDAAPAQSGVFGLAAMERELMLQEMGYDFDYPRFSAAYDLLKAGYPTEVGKDRLVTATWWYIRESVNSDHDKEAWEGVQTLRRLQVSQKQRAALLVKDLIRPYIYKAQQKTASQLNPDDFHI